MRLFLTITLFCFCLLTFICCKSHRKPIQSTRPKVSLNKESEQQSNQKVNKVISTARSYIGTPYKFGGTSRSGMDCSGLMILSFKEVGLSLPRTSQEQSSIGKAINFSDIKPGDLVFFVNKKGDSQITHVGLVSAVNGSRDVKFIHSSTKLGVVESDLYVSYYENILIKATRVL